jgi:hypothetical protein
MNNIICDVDGIVLDFLGQFLKFLKEEKNYILEREKVVHFSFPKIMGISDNEFLNDYYGPFMNSKYSHKLGYLRGSKEFFSKLHTKYHIHFLTAYSVYFPQNRQFRVDNLKDIKYKEIIYDDKKVKYIKKINPLYIFEDRPQTIAEYSKCNDFNGIIFVPVTPYTIGKCNFKKVEYYNNFNEIRI